LSDFGSAQTSFNLEFTDEFIDLGGNLSLRAPEIRRAKLGTILDYSLADLWSAATMGYEIFTRINPFYSELNSATYTQEDLPELPKRLHYAVKSMIYQTLRINPEDRPLPHVAANVVCMSLFRFGAELKSILDECGINLELSTTNFKHAVSKILNDVSSGGFLGE
jgi:serine/threonine protein kinase